MGTHPPSRLAARLSSPEKVVQRPPIRRRALAWVYSSRLDQRLAGGADPLADPLLAYRATKITSRGFRHRLAAGLRDAVERAAHPHRHGAAAPVSLAGVRAHRTSIEDLADRLDGGSPVAAQGVALASRLLTNGASPLYVEGQPRELRAAISAIEIGLGP